MFRFNRDYALIRPTSYGHHVIAESHSRGRLEQLCLEMLQQGIWCEVIKSELPRR